MSDVTSPSSRSGVGAARATGRIVVPATDVAWTRAIVAIFRAASAAPPGWSAYVDTHTMPTIEKRNYLAERFLESDDAWMLMVDSDVLPPPDVVTRLLDAVAESDSYIVSALYFTRYPPFRPAAGYWTHDERVLTWMDPKELDGGLRQVDWVGTGCLLLHRSVLETLAEERGQRIFRGLELRGRPTGRGEDQEFCEAAGELGFSIHCATGVAAGHLGLVEIGSAIAAGRVDASAPDGSGPETPAAEASSRVTFTPSCAHGRLR